MLKFKIRIKDFPVHKWEKMLLLLVNQFLYNFYLHAWLVYHHVIFHLYVQYFFGYLLVVFILIQVQKGGGLALRVLSVGGDDEISFDKEKALNRCALKLLVLLAEKDKHPLHEVIKWLSKLNGDLSLFMDAIPELVGALEFCFFQPFLLLNVLFCKLLR